MGPGKQSELYGDQVNTTSNLASTSWDAVCSIDRSKQQNFSRCGDDNFGIIIS